MKIGLGPGKSGQLTRMVLPAIVLLGVALRLSLLLQSRDLIIDEANLARNLYERGITGLAAPLSYEQYAPPVFLWIEKAATLLGGFGEIALRCYPFLCGAGVLLLFLRIGHELRLRAAAIMYPLLLLATGEIYLRYSTELKQYMPDAFITLLLAWLALRTLSGPRGPRFAATWLAAGSLAIWSSMPSVFVLAAAGGCFGLRALRLKDWKAVLLLTGIAAVWLLQFWLYYEMVLKAQIRSDYLQNFHAPFFLNVNTGSAAAWTQNGEVLGGWLGAAWGHWALSTGLNGLLLIAGLGWLWKSQRAASLLLLLPILLLLLAVARHHYSLIHRLALFSMPLLLLLIAAGVDWLLRLRWRPLPWLVAVPAAVCAFNFGHFRWLLTGPDYEPIRVCMNHALSQEAAVFCVMETASPAVRYYSEIHPRREQYRPFLQAEHLPWNADYDSLALTVHGRMALLSSRTEPALYQQRLDRLKRRLRETAFFEVPERRCSSAILEPPPHQGISHAILLPPPL